MTTTESSTEIELIAPVQGGQMLARRAGQVVFLHGGIPGETVVHGNLAAKRGYLEGDAEAVVRTVPARTEPPCPYFGENTQRRGSIQAEASMSGPVCGGCKYQHVAYAAQLELKNQIVREQMRRVGKIVDAPVQAVQPSPTQYAYRNKAAWIVTANGELAYHEARSHQLVPIDECLLLTPELLGIFDCLRAASPEIGLSGIARSIEARSLPRRDGGEVGTLALTYEAGLSDSEATAVAEALLDVCPMVESISGASIDRAEQHSHLAGRERIETAFLDEDMCLSPSTFFQVNLPVATLMARHVLEQMGTLGKRVVLDAYCGAGTFTVPAARRAEAVIALEIDPNAVADLRETLARVGADNVTILEGDAGTGLRSLLPGTIDCAVIDPPRSGCSPLVLRQLARIKIPRLVYVSCDPSTLARDLRFLLDQGFLLDSVVPYDLFPQTAHIECIATLRLPKRFQAR
jgi:23S rRNA (uracil1939-C5)-methyltransferase